jgi:hypothetical protein
MEDRLAYYREKYGEDFSPAGGETKEPEKKQKQEPSRKGGVRGAFRKLFGAGDRS